MTIKSYNVDFSVQLVDSSPEEAARQAWRGLTEHGILPVANVTDEDGKQSEVDLEEIAQRTAGVTV